MKYSRAYGKLQVKSLDDDQRIIYGIASTPTPDRVDDIVDAKGAKFTLPIPFLWQHNHSLPIGEVKSATITDAGIEVEVHIAKVEEEGNLKNRVDEAWQSMKAGLVKGLSIGFRGIDCEPIKGAYGVHFKTWDWFELSAVTIPANVEATITSVKQIFDSLEGSESESKPSAALEQINQKTKEEKSIVGVSTKQHLTVKLGNPTKGGVKLL